MNVKETVRTLRYTPIDTAIMLKGNHGIGKSAVVKQVGEMEDCPVIDFRLSQNDVGDIKGIPFQRNGRTIFSPPEFMPITQEDADELKKLLGLAEDISLGRFGDRGILFLDEINRASREVQQAAFELVLDRRLNLRSLPEGWRVVTAINDNDDLYTVGSLDPAFVSRFMVIDFNPSRDEWLQWARENGIHDAVITFLTKHESLLDPSKEMIDENNKEGVRKLFDRRSWHKFSNTLNAFEERDESLLDKSVKGNMNYLVQVATGFLGSTCAVKFMKFIESDYETLNAETILGKWSDEVAQKLQAVVDARRTPELAAYSELIFEFFKAREGKKLPKDWIQNLNNFLALMPKEVVSGFWKSFNNDMRALSEKWYDPKGNPESVKIVLGAIVNPNAMTSN